jgi:hypothetical protein
MEKDHADIHDVTHDDTKPKLAEYLENGDSPEAIEFKQKEAKVRRKLDLYIAPVMMLLMLISYLDRGNIGFAGSDVIVHIQTHLLIL